MEYDLGGTPCQSVVGKKFQFIPDHICQSYPGDNMLSQMGFRSYAGYPLFDSQGEALGLIAVLHRGTLHAPDFIEAILRIFSVRAAAELERLRTRSPTPVRVELSRHLRRFGGLPSSCTTSTPAPSSTSTPRPAASTAMTTRKCSADTWPN
jgi:hypothetical protein